MFTETFELSEIFWVDDWPPVSLMEFVRELFMVIFEVELFADSVETFVEFCLIIVEVGCT